MQAATATILAFPRRLPSSDADELELAPEQQLASEPAASRLERSPPAAIALPTVSWAANLLPPASFFLSPRGGTAADVLAVVLAILAFTAAGWAAPRLPREVESWRHGRPWRELLSRQPVLVALAALAAALVLGPAPAFLILLFGCLELARPHLPGSGWCRSVAAAAAYMLRLEAGAAVLGADLAPEMRLAALLLAAFLPLAASVAKPRVRPSLDRELLLLALLAGTAVLYTAALLGDPWVQRAAGVSPLLSVPPLMLGLLRYWQIGGSRHRNGEAPDPWLAGAAVAWAVLLTLTVPVPSL